MQNPNEIREEIKQNLSNIKEILIVFSNKGGVGKSTVASIIATKLWKSGKKVGLLDIDIHGPDIPVIFNLDEPLKSDSEGKILPVKIDDNFYVISVQFGLQEDRTAPVVWRGPLKHSLITQFLKDVKWGELDYLVVDCPPGTGDEVLSLFQLMPKEKNTILVTTASSLSVEDMLKANNFVKMVAGKVKGVVLNFAYVNCPKCNEKIDLFGSIDKTVERLKAVGIDKFIKLPLDSTLQEKIDNGKFVEWVDNLNVDLEEIL